MKNNLLKIFSVISIAVMVIIISAGCSGAGSTTTTTGFVTATSTATATESTAGITESTAIVTAAASKASSEAGDSNVIIWDQAIDYIGEKVTVFGPIIDSTYDAGYTILGMGMSVNASGVVTIKISDVDIFKFPGDLYIGEVIKVTGTVEADAANEISITVTDPSQIEVTL